MRKFCKWTDSSVMWYLHIADEKCERFNYVAQVIMYLMQVFTKYHWCKPKWSDSFVMSVHIVIWFQEYGTGLLIHKNGYHDRNEVSPLLCNIFTSLMRKVRDIVLFQEGFRTYSPNATPASKNEVIHLWCNSRFSSHGKKTEQDY